MDRDKIIELACHGEDMSLFSGTYIEAIHEYDGTAKDKEFLAFFAFKKLYFQKMQLKV